MFSALLSISLFLDAFVLNIKAELPHLDPGFDFEVAEIMYFLSISLFPCTLSMLSSSSSDSYKRNINS